MVADGLTVVEPVADVDVKEPGVMAMLVALVVAQLSMLVPPAAMLVGLAVKVLMVGRAGRACTVTVAVAVAVPVALVAVRV
jgi:hypothetical protein